MNIEGERMREDLIEKIKAKAVKLGSIVAAARWAGLAESAVRDILCGRTKQPCRATYLAFGIRPPASVKRQFRRTHDAVATTVARYRAEGKPLIIARIALDSGCSATAVRSYLDSAGIRGDHKLAGKTPNGLAQAIERSDAATAAGESDREAVKVAVDAERATRYAPLPVPPPTHSLADEVKAHLKRERSLRRWARERGLLLERDPGLGQALAAVAVKRKVRGGRDGWRNCVTIDPAAIKQFWSERQSG